MVCREARRPLEIEIQDNGAGFSPEALEKVPQPFFTTRNVGLGLGNDGQPEDY